MIGAFKHAGRRRMAFRVGTKIAKFHRSVREGGEREEWEGKEVYSSYTIMFPCL